MSHLEQANGFSSVCVMLCLFKGLLCVNAQSHFKQANGLSSVCIMSCLLNWFLCLNAMSHLEQANGFSSVCIMSCTFNYLNALSHLEQANDFSSCVCHVMPLQMVTLFKCHITLGIDKCLLLLCVSFHAFVIGYSV